jgi:hypothetical protein
MRACKRCRYAVPMKDGDGKEFYSCALLPPRGEVFDGKLNWIRPPMSPHGWCGQFKLSLKRLIWGHGAA